MTKRILTLLVAAGALGAMTVGTDAFAQPKGEPNGTFNCIQAPCIPPGADKPKPKPRPQHGNKPNVVCIQAPCEFSNHDKPKPRPFPRPVADKRKIGKL